MAMPLPTEPTTESHEDRPRVRPESRTRARTQADDAPAEARPSGPRPAPKRRHDPDEEALRLFMAVIERAEVAKAFASLAGGLVTVTAARAAAQLRAVADQKIAEAAAGEGPFGSRSRYARWIKVARAAKDAALHVATHRPEREPSTDAAPDQ